MQDVIFRSSHPEVFLGKDVLKVCCKLAASKFSHYLKRASKLLLLNLFFSRNILIFTLKNAMNFTQAFDNIIQNNFCYDIAMSQFSIWKKENQNNLKYEM